MSSTVEDWLRSLGLIQYTQAFLDNGYDELDICKEIGEEDLDAIGVKNIKDRVDILSAVARLQQSGTAVYFVLEEGTQPTPPTQTREKIIPLKLKMNLRNTLKDDSIDLTEPPYTLPNGACGNLENLVTLYADKFYTYEEDVLEALESIRARQVGDLKSQQHSEKGDDDVAYDQVESTSPTHHKHKRSNTTPLNTVAKETSQWYSTSSSLNSKGLPADYLDVDSPSSPLKKVKRRRPVERNSKLSRSLDSLKELHVNTETKTKEKDQQTSKPKQSSLFGLFRSSKRKSPGHENKSHDSKSFNDISKPVAGGDFPASNITMGEEDRVTLMLMVKRGELTVEEAVEQLESYEKENKKNQASKKEIRRSGSCSEEESLNSKQHKLKRNIFGRSTKKKSSSRPVSEIAACDMTMSEEDRISLMRGVRDHEITVEEAVQRLLNYEEDSPGHKSKVNKHKFSPKSPHSFSRLSIKRVSGAFSSAVKGGPPKEEKSAVFYTQEGPANTSSEDDGHWPSDSSPDPSPAGHRKAMHNLIRGAQQIHSTSSLHSSSSSSDAVDRLGTIEDLENQESPKKGSHPYPDKRMVDEMKIILSKRVEQEEASKGKGLTPSPGSSPIHSSTLPRNIKPNQASLTRKSSLPITPSVHPAPTAHTLRKPPPPPPPRALPRQSTMPLIEPRAVSPDNDTEKEPAKGKKPKPPILSPRRKSLGDNSKNLAKDLDSKLSDEQRSLSPPLPPPPCPPTNQEDTNGQQTSGESEDLRDLPSPPSENETSKMNNRMSLEDDVFPPPPPEHLLTSLKPVNREEVEGRKKVAKPPRPSLLKHAEDAAKTSSENYEAKEEIKQKIALQEMTPSPPGQPGSAGPTECTGHLDPSGSTGPKEPLVSQGPPVTKPKPAVKRKPKLPPKPPKPTPESTLKKSQDESSDRDDSTTGADQQSSLNVFNVPVPRKRPSHSLSDLIERRLRIEQIDLTDPPYSSEDGRWGVPINLIDRYTEEMRRSQIDVVEIMDRIRRTKLREKSRPAVPCDVSLYPQEPDHLGKLGTIEEWLVSLGLPMYLDNLKEVEYDDMANMPFLKQKHFEYAGVVDLRHMRRLLASVERMPK